MDTTGSYYDWNSFQSKYLTGDLVNTEFGPAIIREVSNAGSELEQYSVWPLPECKKVKRGEGWYASPKWAWYHLSELELIEYGPAHFIREKFLSDYKRRA